MIHIDHLGYRVTLPNGVQFFGDTKAEALERATKYLAQRDKAAAKNQADRLKDAQRDAQRLRQR